MSKRVKDHLGKEFSSVSEMCRYWGIERVTYLRRVRIGWTKEQALTNKKPDLISDHLGKEFSSILDMCTYYGIENNIYDNRIRAGWSKEKALTTPVAETNVVCRDHLGNIYSSISDMCKKYSIGVTTYMKRIKRGYNLEEALTKPVNKYKSPVRNGIHDHLGNEYSSLKSMCKAYGISVTMWYDRLHKGYSLEKILTAPAEGQRVKADVKYKDHLGNEYNTIREMCEAYSIKETTYLSRRRKGWGVAKSLTHPTK